MNTSMNLYMEAKDITGNIPEAVERLTSDLYNLRNTSWMDNHYIPTNVYYEIIDSLSTMNRREFMRKQQQTVIPNRAVFSEEEVLRIIDDEYEHLMNMTRQEFGDEFEEGGEFY